MLGDSKKNVRDPAIQIILKIRIAASLKKNLTGPHVRQFVVPPTDCKAITYGKMSILSATTMSEPSLLLLLKHLHRTKGY